LVRCTGELDPMGRPTMLGEPQAGVYNQPHGWCPSPRSPQTGWGPSWALRTPGTDSAPELGPLPTAIPAVEVVLAGADLLRAGVAPIHQLLHHLVDVQDPSHDAVHLLVQALKPGEETQAARSPLGRGTPASGPTPNPTPPTYAGPPQPHPAPPAPPSSPTTAPSRPPRPRRRAPR